MDATSGTGAGAGASTATSLTTFACNICKAKFETNAQQRNHTKTDWHVYNLKRNIASLPPITENVFKNQVVFSAQSSAKRREEAADGFHESCTICEKTYFSSTPYRNHFKSASHLQEVARLESRSEMPSTMERITPRSEDIDLPVHEDVDFAPSRCLFCLFDSSTLNLNMAHMQKKHGLFVPESENLLDLESFVGYLFAIITDFNECLYCGSQKISAEATRSHMISRGHCNLKPDPGSEYEDFYVASSDVESGNDEPTGKGVSTPVVAVENELRLPSGRTLGHRSQAKYFRQHHTPIRTKSTERKGIEGADKDEECANTESEEDTKTTSRQLTKISRSEMGIIGVSDFQKKALVAVEKKMLKAEQRAKSDYQAGLERFGNKQKYFRTSTDCVFDMTK